MNRIMVVKLIGVLIGVMLCMSPVAGYAGEEAITFEWNQPNIGDVNGLLE
jgi:hypothetical protein